MSSGSMPDSETNIRSNPHNGSSNGLGFLCQKSLRATRSSPNRLWSASGTRKATTRLGNENW